MSRKRQPWPRVMLSASTPPNAASVITIRFSSTSASPARSQAHVAAQILVQLVEDAPGVARQAVADQPGDVAQLAQRVAQPGLAVFGEQRVEHLRLELARSTCSRRAPRAAACCSAVSARTSTDELGGVGEARGLGEPRGRGAEEAHEALAALGVAAQPEQVVGDAAGQVAAAAASARRRGRRPAQQAEGADRAVGEDPGVLAAAAALHRHDHRARRRRRRASARRA